MLTDIHFDTESQTHLKNLMTEAQLRRLLQEAARPRQPQRQRLPKTSVLRKLVLSLGCAAP
jgi:exopolyphosphatase/pppGpp-phosphohydrolase